MTGCACATRRAATWRTSSRTTATVSHSTSDGNSSILNLSSFRSGCEEFHRKRVRLFAGGGLLLRHHTEILDLLKLTRPSERASDDEAGPEGVKNGAEAKINFPFAMKSHFSHAIALEPLFLTSRHVSWVLSFAPLFSLSLSFFAFTYVLHTFTPLIYIISLDDDVRTATTRSLPLRM